MWTFPMATSKDFFFPFVYKSPNLSKSAFSLAVHPYAAECWKNRNAAISYREVFYCALECWMWKVISIFWKFLCSLLLLSAKFHLGICKQVHIYLSTVVCLAMANKTGCGSFSSILQSFSKQFSLSSVKLTVTGEPYV